jgi:hypothetical protein
MATLYRAFLSGVVDDNPLLIGATTLNSTGLSNLPAVTAPDILWLALDPDGVAGTPELVKVTAHTAAATSCTIVRGQQTSKGGGAARQHLQNTVWMHVVSPDDFDELPFKKLTTTGDLLYASAANTASRLAIGTTGQVLEVVGGVPTWGQVDAAGIASDAVTTAKILDANVTTAKIADANVTLAKLAAAAYAQPATANTLAYRDASGRTQVATPVSGTDAANKAYVDAVGNGAWQGPLTLANTHTGTVVYRNVGNVIVVECRGLAGGNGNPVVGTLPVGYRPNFGTSAGVLVNSTNSVLMMSLATNGDLSQSIGALGATQYWGSIICQRDNS